jgi:16S rRNA processing protein RimM
MTRDWDAMLVVGRIARPHGLRGELVVNPETDFPESRFRPGNVLFVASAGAARALEMVSVRFHQGRPLVAFDGIDSIEAVEALGRGELRMPPEGFEPLPEGTYRRHDLVGCTVSTEAGEPIGRVVKVEGAAASSVLVVQGPGREVLIPLAAAICVTIDVAAGRIVVAPPDGLLDVNG